LAEVEKQSPLKLVGHFEAKLDSSPSSPPEGIILSDALIYEIHVKYSWATMKHLKI